MAVAWVHPKRIRCDCNAGWVDSSALRARGPWGAVVACLRLAGGNGPLAGLGAKVVRPCTTQYASIRGGVSVIVGEEDVWVTFKVRVTATIQGKYKGRVRVRVTVRVRVRRSLRV